MMINMKIKILMVNKYKAFNSKVFKDFAYFIFEFAHYPAIPKSLNDIFLQDLKKQICCKK